MSDHNKKSLGRRWSDLQPSKTMLVWSCAGSVALALVVGFTWGGWVTGGTARDMAKDAGDASRYELASVICAENFMAAADARAQLIALKSIDSAYGQRQFIDDGGWATMPGKEKAARQTAAICADVLAKIEVSAVAPDGEAQVEPISDVQ